MCQVTQYVVEAQNHLKLSHGYTNCGTILECPGAQCQVHTMLREVIQKNCKVFMTLAIRRRTPLPLVALFPLHFFPIFSCAMEYYIYETDFTLGLSQKYHFQVL